MQMMEDTGSVTTDNGTHCIHCMTIVGQIEGHYVLPRENKEVTAWPAGTTENSISVRIRGLKAGGAMASHNINIRFDIVY